MRDWEKEELKTEGLGGSLHRELGPPVGLLLASRGQVITLISTLPAEGKGSWFVIWRIETQRLLD